MTSKYSKQYSKQCMTVPMAVEMCVNPTKVVDILKNQVHLSWRTTHSIPRAPTIITFNAYAINVQDFMTYLYSLRGLRGWSYLCILEWRYRFAGQTANSWTSSFCKRYVKNTQPQLCTVNENEIFTFISLLGVYVSWYDEDRYRGGWAVYTSHSPG